jgi:hypothetical protein
MLPAGRFRLRVIAELGESNSSIYALGLQCSSITGALYSLSESLAMRTDDGTIRGEELAAELVQMLCPMADGAELLPADAEWTADATLQVRITEELDVDSGFDVDVVQLELAVHSGGLFPEAGAGSRIEELSTERDETGEIEEAIGHAALLDEWNCVCELDGFSGKADVLFEKLRTHLDGRAALARWVLFASTAQRAEIALLDLYVTHDARKPLQRLTTALDRIYKAERRYQENLNTQNRMKELQ